MGKKWVAPNKILEEHFQSFIQLCRSRRQEIETGNIVNESWRKTSQYLHSLQSLQAALKNVGEEKLRISRKRVKELSDYIDYYRLIGQYDLLSSNADCKINVTDV
ncbi:hypothetical protein TKK_0004370 [Trichogramma kaykai]